MSGNKQYKIKFFYAGGTIGMKANQEGSLVAPRGDEEFREVCMPVIRDWQRRNNVEIDYEFYTSKDSTNMTPDDWQVMLYLTNRAQKSGYDAVTFVHGTDTMAYAASAIAFANHGKDPNKSALQIPVVFTGAQNAVYEFGGDGLFNLQNLFRTALSAIENQVTDVLINFGYDILLGCRSLKISERSFNAFEAPSELGRVGHIDAYGVHLYLHRLKVKGQLQPGEIQAKFSKGVLVLDLGPGTEPGMLESLIRNSNVMAMVMKSPGEGNVCTQGVHNLLPFIKMATNYYEIPILIASKFVGGAVGRARYELGRAAIDAGVISCYDTTDTAVEVKLRWLLGNRIATTIEEVRQAMRTNYVGEVAPHEH